MRTLLMLGMAVAAFSSLTFAPAEARDYLLWSKKRGSPNAETIQVNDHGNGRALSGTYCGRTLYVPNNLWPYRSRVLVVRNVPGQMKLVNHNYSAICTIKND